MDTLVAAGAFVVAVAGLALGGLFSWAGLLLATVGGVAYLTWFRESGQTPPATDSHTNTATSGQAVLWADTDAALRLLDRFPLDSDLGEVVTRLSRLGRRAVERWRATPAEPAAVRTRHVLCLTAETLSAFEAAGKGRNPRQEQRFKALLDQAIDTLSEDAGNRPDERQLCSQLRVLESELKSTQTRG